jgi:hypothetical protein
MKRFVLIPLLLLFISNFIHAQNFNFGVKAGAQMVNITHLNDGKNTLLYHAGGFLEIPLAQRLQVQAEALFSAQGVDDSESDDLKQRNVYLQVPLSAKFQVWNRLSVHAGAQFGMLLSAKMKYKDGDTKESFDNKEDFKKADFGLLAGAEYLLTKRIGVGARVNWGLAKVFTDWDKSRQRVYQVFVSYRFNASEF